MAVEKHGRRLWNPAFIRVSRTGCVGLAALAMGACAQMGAKLDSGLSTATGSTVAAKAETPPGQAPQTELEKATHYWGRQYAQNPRDEKAALSYARNLKAMGQKTQAMNVLQQAQLFHADDRTLASEYGRLALDLDQVSVARQMLELADDPANPDWRVISARGTVLARSGRNSESIPFFERALSLSPEQPSLLNNLALAYAMNGEAEKAEPYLRKAASHGATSAKVRQNLALVLGLQGKYDEATRLSAQDIAPDKAAANTALVRRMVQLDPKAAPAVQAADAPAVAGLRAADAPAVAGWQARVEPQRASRRDARSEAAPQLDLRPSAQ